jgi:membrane peptidoglycan carboxypeptidase
MPTPLTILRLRRHRRDNQRTRTRRGNRRVVAGLGFLASLLLALVVITAAVLYASLTSGLPSLEKLDILLNPENGQLLQPTRLYDRTGQHLVAVLAPEDEARTFIPYDQLPRALLNATLALTEPGFMQSPGYSLKSWQDPASHPTLAQRLIFDLLLWDQPATRRRAIHERMLAAQVTARYGRQQVLEWYLNSTDFGNHAYGVDAAARLYFGKPASQLDLGESAMLAAVSQAPDLNPIDAGSQAEGRRVQTLMVMQAMNFITSDQALQAMTAAPRLAPSESAGRTAALAPAFTRLALEQLDAVFGAGRVERGGLVIRTSLDLDLQLETACTIESALSALAGGNPSINTADGSDCLAASLLPRTPLVEIHRDVSASAVLLDPQSGQVLALVGDTGSAQDGSRLLPGPAGTSITPFIYLTGLTRGLSPAASCGICHPMGRPISNPSMDRSACGLPWRMITFLLPAACSDRWDWKASGWWQPPSGWIFRHGCWRRISPSRPYPWLVPSERWQTMASRQDNHWLPQRCNPLWSWKCAGWTMYPGWIGASLPASPCSVPSWLT